MVIHTLLSVILVAGPVTVIYESSDERLLRAEESAISVIVKVEEPWFIYACTDKNEGQGLTGLLVEMDSSVAVQFLDPKYPAYYSIGDYDVYLSGNTAVKVPFRVRSNSPEGTQSIVGRVRFQACNQEMCLPPSSVDLSYPIEVVYGLSSR